MNRQNIANLIKRGHVEEAQSKLLLLEESGIIDAGLYCSIAMLMQKKCKTHEALDYFAKVLEIEPKHTIALANTGQLHSGLGKKTLAEKYLKRAWESAPDHSMVSASYAGVLLSLRKYDQSINCYKDALKFNSGNIQAFSGMLLALNYTEQDHQEVFKQHAYFSKAVNEKIKTLPLYGHEKLRIAYISGDFRRHSVPFFIEGFLHFHNRQKYEVYCYSDGDREDLITERFKKLSDHWREISTISDEDVLIQIQKDEIDILIDLGAHTGRRLPVFAKRAAPIQISYCGYPNTTGLKNMDYRIVDELTDPDGEEFYTEKLLRLKRCFLAFNPPDDAPEVGSLPYLTNGYVTFGSFNNFTKINNKVLRVWRQLLKSVPKSRLLLKSKHFNDKELKNEVKAFFTSRGIAEERINIHGFELKLKNHLDFYNRVDIALDSFPYNGTTTTCEALYMGVPVITVRGVCHVARVGVSLLSSMGLSSFVAADLAEYRVIASDLAKNVKLMKSLRANMRGLMFNSSLCDSLSLVRDIENQFQTVIDNISQPLL